MKTGSKSSWNLTQMQDNQKQFFEKCHEQNQKLAQLYGKDLKHFITLANEFDEIINTKYRKG